MNCPISVVDVGSVSVAQARNSSSWMGDNAQAPPFRSNRTSASTPPSWNSLSHARTVESSRNSASATSVYDQPLSSRRMAFARRTMRCSSSPSLTIFIRSARSVGLRKLRFVFTRRVESIPLIRSNDFRKGAESRYTMKLTLLSSVSLLLFINLAAAQGRASCPIGFSVCLVQKLTEVSGHNGSTASSAASAHGASSSGSGSSSGGSHGGASGGGSSGGGSGGGSGGCSGGGGSGGGSGGGGSGGSGGGAGAGGGGGGGGGSGTSSASAGGSASSSGGGSATGGGTASASGGGSGGGAGVGRGGGSGSGGGGGGAGGGGGS